MFTPLACTSVAIETQATDLIETIGDEHYTKAFVSMTKETNHPRVQKPLNAPIFTHATAVSAPSMYWPWLVDRSAAGGDGVDLDYSTDHAVDNT